MKYLWLFLFCACCRQNEGHPITASDIAPEDDFQTTKLFTADGCAVYRFHDDGLSHYFTNCEGSALTTESRNEGKVIRHYSRENQTTKCKQASAAGVQNEEK